MPTGPRKARRLHLHFFFILATVPALLACGASQAADHLQAQERTMDYLSQSRPGATPELFAEGVVSTQNGAYGTVVFSPDQSEAFWANDKQPGLFFSRLIDGEWREPEEFPFPEGYRLSSPFFSHDGRQLYFLASGRDQAGMDTDEKIWVVGRDGHGWGEPRELDTQVNSVEKHWQFSADRNENVYFGGEGADVYVSEFGEGEYGRPDRLPPPINTAAPETSPHISKDGDLLLFDRWFETSPYVRIMVSFRDSGDGWSAPVDLSPFTKSEGNDSGARLSPDGRYLFFQSVREGSDPNRSIYWMDAAFLQRIRGESEPDQNAEGPYRYLGETPPGTIPKQFASHILTEQFHSSPVFSPGGDEMYWSGMGGGGLQFMRLENGRWSEPQVAPFNLRYSGEPVFGPDGDTLYFLSSQGYEGSPEESGENVWRVARSAGGWSDPEPLGSPINDQRMHWGISLAANRNLYFGHTGGDGEIFISEFRDGAYQEPVALGPTVNSGDMETTPCVAPDESYLVFSRVVQNGLGPINLYVSFRGQDGSWEEAVPLTGVNTSGREISPRLSPDGTYLFFLRTVNGDLMPFWVSSSVITALRPN